MRRTRRLLLLGAVLALSMSFRAPSPMPSALPGLCGSGHVGGTPLPLDQCTVNDCAGLGVGPIVAEPTANVFVCAEF